MGILKVIDDAPGYLKSTFQGPQGSGKTYTAAKLACVLHKHIASTKPVAFFDTETGSDYVADMLTKSTGHKPIRVKTRAFNDLLQATGECVNGAADILLVDSITHVWRELQDAYLRAVNQDRTYQRDRLTLDDIMRIKASWQRWPELYTNSPLHIIVCGREGSEWSHEENEETGKHDLIATGKKMKVEGEFAYEASLMVAMSREDRPETRTKAKGGKRGSRPRTVVRYATVIKDRFDLIDGQKFADPTGEEFMPFIRRLNPARHRPVDTQVKSQETMDGNGDNEWGREKRRREKLCQEIESVLIERFPGAQGKDRVAKIKIIRRVFDTGAWKVVEDMHSDRLHAGLDQLRALLADEDALRDLLTQEAVTD